MKLTTTILLLFVCFGCKIREKKPIITPKSNGVSYATYVCLDCNDTSGKGGTVNQYDTQKVIMLVCDTSSFVEVDSHSTTFDAHGNIVPNATHDYHSSWLYGYKVIGNERITYLHTDKKPLSKSIIVWQTKELK